MRKYSKLRFVLNMIPAMLGWAALMLAVWGLIFMRLDDAPSAKKLVIYTDCTLTDSRRAIIALEDACGVSGSSPGIFDDADICKIKLRPTSYSIMGESPALDGDIFIISESRLDEVKEYFSPLPDEIASSFEVYSIEGVAIGALIGDPNAGRYFYEDTLHYEKGERYYLCFGINSRHTGADDSAAYALAEYMLSQAN